MSDEASAVEKLSLGTLFLLSLALAYFATATLDVLPNLLLMDIAATFQTTLGAASQIRTFTNIATFATALLMGVLSVRFKHKALLLTGVGFMLISSLGCFFAPTLSWMQFYYSLNGVGSAMVLPMALALIGDFLPLEKRAKAVGYMVAMAPLSFFISVPITGILANFGDWRLVPLLFSVPFSVVGLLLAFFGLPASPHKQSSTVTKKAYLRSFKQVFLNKSATACLVGNILRTAAYSATLYFGISFYRGIFSMSLNLGTGLMMGGTLIFTLGSIIGGRIANRFGRKTLTVAASFLSGALTMFFFLMPDFWMALPFDYSEMFMAGIAFSTATSLSLDQVPESRGTMMSLNSAVLAVGGALAAAVGGTVLDLFSYGALGLTLGATGVIAAAVFYFLTKDPSRTKLPVTKHLAAESAA
jgi:predicted MFS family arabinose efflux permease